MKHQPIPVIALTVCCLVQLPTGANDAHPNHFLPGQQAHDKATALSQLSWYTSLYQAESVAQQNSKMIFWLHMLGSLRGAT